MQMESISKKEQYITEDNLEEKNKTWHEKIALYNKNKNRFTFNPADSILLIIDMQLFFLDNRSHAYIPSAPSIVPNIRKLLFAYRDAHLPVIYTRHALMHNEKPGIMGRWWNDIIKNEDPQSEIISALLPQKDEIIIRKTKYSAFIGTELEDFLTIKMVKNIVICGVTTHLCCDTTARDAFMKDFTVFFVTDGTASHTEELHLSSLRTLSSGFAIPITTQEILMKIKEKGI